MTVNWRIEWLPEALEDMRQLDKGIQALVLKAVQRRLVIAPDRYGEPLRNDDPASLAGFRRVRIQSLRLVYAVILDRQTVWVAAVGKRDGEEVYRAASERIRKLRRQVETGTQEMDDLLRQFLTRNSGG